MIALLALALVLAAAAFVLSYRRAEVSPLARVPDHNPGHFVPSDVAQLTSTGRPQMVEVFHYG
jgi:hypothetical protein